MRDVRSQGSNADGKDAVNEGSSGGPTTNSVPAISLPKGGGAIRGIGEKYGANPVTGTGSLNVPIATSPGRSGFGPQLSLSYDSGAGNGPFGLGWNLSLPAITRKTDKGLPRYLDAAESDVFILSGAEDLVPVLQPDGSRFEDDTLAPEFTIHRYRPRIDGLFARIERWTKASGEIHWRSITRDNVTTVYGKTAESRIADPNDLKHTFTWLICESYDDKGNAIVYEYAGENDENVDHSQVNERNRQRTANRYLKRINYGNKTSRLIDPDLTQTKWMFEVVFDYDEDHLEGLDLDSTRPEAEQHRLVRAAASPGLPWTVRPDPFSVHRAGFEVRTYRRCRRVLMFHRFDELGAEPYLVRSTEFDYTDLDYSQPVTVKDELAHVGSTRFASFIRGVTQSGYVRDDSQPVLERNGVKYVTYLRKSLPPLEFEYSKAAIQDDIRELDAGSLENLPIGLDGAAYQWVDLDGEGVSGILTEQGDAWFYKPNLGEGHFGSLQTLRTQPAGSSGTGPKHQFLDLAGDGQLDVVQFSGPVSGFYERTDDGGWNSFTTFSSLPNLDWGDPNLRFVDLTGDGHADILITEDDAFTWLPSLAEEGFGSFELVRLALDEERGPKLVFADGEQSIYLADMCGDGLTDLVRIRNGEVCYWPNLGYGRFGAKVTMDGAPRFDNPDQFDQRRIRLADIDGSGASDIIYLGRDEVSLHFNQSGNSWSEPRPVSQFPPVDNLSSVMTADLLGNGTACLVWSSPLPGDAHRPMRYIDLIGGQKPHLLTSSVNNLGAETRVTYAASTKFYLADKLAGNPWITKIPFPVHVVERVETFDHITRNRFVTRYAYHHGYFDGVEREFRGFGMVEQRDTEQFAALNVSDAFPVGDNIDAASHVPPVHTKTWFHTGVYVARDNISSFFAGLINGNDRGEYYREPAWLDDDVEARKRLLDDTVLPSGLTVDEEREACRALKGSMLRQEVYALDGSAKEKHPYTVTEQNFTIRRLQPMAGNRHAVFFAHARESISYHYEREPSDPRITHALTMEVDEFGNVLKSAAVAYGRRQPDSSLEPRDQAKQAEVLITYSENDVTKFVEGDDDHRTPLPSEARTYELTGYAPSGVSGRFQMPDFVQPAGDGLAHVFDSEINYEEKPSSGKQRRLIEQVRTYYRPNDLGVSHSDPLALLPLGELQSLALPGESYKLAFTPGLVAAVYGGRATDAMLADEGRYVHSEGDDNWWIPSGRVFYSPDATDTAVEELAQARAHFFLPRRYRDPFHSLVSTETLLDYDTFDLLVQETRDALGNRITVGERDIDASQPLALLGQDYRVLQPALVMGPNRNRSAAAFDALGMVVGTAVMGKPEEVPVPGDRLAGTFRADLTQAEINQFFTDPKGVTAAALLDSATTRIVYNLTRYWREPDPQTKLPAFSATLARETHSGASTPAGGLRIQASFCYSDGFGREIQKKVQAEAGPAPIRDGTGRIITVDGESVMTPGDVSPRWVGSGWTIFNNKGKPVRQYEPFFTDTHDFEFDARIGVSAVLFYDPAQRLVGTLHPNHTWEKLIVDPWKQATWDVNDTVQVDDPRTDSDVGEFFRRLPQADYLPTWRAPREAGELGAEEQAAARKAGVHADTPSVAHVDTLGRAFLAIVHNRFKRSDMAPGDPPTEEFHLSRIVFDVKGSQREVIDAKQRAVMRYAYDILSNRVHQSSMEAGERWTLNDVGGKPLYAWDSRDHQFRTAYDQLRRPVQSYMREGAGAELLVGRTVYGEGQPDPQSANLRGKMVEVSDQAGIVNNDEYDFKGNLLSSRRRLAREYKGTLNWSGPVLLEAETFTSRTRFDAMNRPTQLIAPHSNQPDAKVNIIQPVYNEANLLDQVHAWLNQDVEPAGPLDPGGAGMQAVTDIDYNAKGQRTLIEFGSGVRTTYEYDRLTFRLINLLTRRDAVAFPDDCPQPPPSGWPGCQVQNLRYTYDPAGNITHISDAAQQRICFRNRRVEPSAEYTYDAIYRLIEATGREHLGQVAGASNPPNAPDAFNGFHTHLDHPGDGNAMGTYVERYVYDETGNILSVQHRGSDPAHAGWTRDYVYNEISQLEAGKKNNRLSSSTVAGVTELYRYDAPAGSHGNITAMTPLPLMEWDYRDQLKATSKQVLALGTPETTWCAYDAGGLRVRKVTERASAGPSTTRMKERIYLDGFEIYREYENDGVTTELERTTLHIMDDKQRIALVETRTDTPAPEQLIRYQFANHLGSACLELDDQARIVSYEEYYPYGGTSYQAVRDQTETPKRYRYAGKERDDESGLYYHGARYYAAWLARWVNCDPAGLVDGGNLYRCVRNNPIRLSDRNGMNPSPPGEDPVVVGPLQFRNPQLSFQNFQASANLSFQNLFSANRSVSVNSAQASGQITATSSLAIPSFGLTGTSRLQLNLDQLHIQNQLFRAEITGRGSIQIPAPIPLRLSLDMSASGTMQLDPRIVLGNWRQHLQNSVNTFRGEGSLLARLDAGPLAAVARLDATARGREGDLTASGYLRIGSYRLVTLQGAGSFNPERYQVGGTFSGRFPLVLRGNWRLDSETGFSASGNYFGIQAGAIGLGATPDKTSSDQQQGGAGGARYGGEMETFEPGTSIGYTYFSYRSSSRFVFSAGFSPSSELVTRGPGRPRVPVIGDLPVIGDAVHQFLYGSTLTRPAGPYIGARIAVTF